MDKKLSNYKDIIKKLLPIYDKEELKKNIINLLRYEKKSTHSLILKEIIRLRTKSSQQIDLRKTTILPCKIYKYNGVEHYLSVDVAKVFIDTLKVYKGVYTIGVYEEAIEQNLKKTNNIKNNNDININLITDQKNNEQSKNLKTLNKITYLNFSKRITRQNERLKFVIKLNISSDTFKNVPASSSDISKEGLKIRIIKKYKLQINQIIWVSFVDKKSLKITKQEEKEVKGYKYKVVSFDKQNNDSLWFGLKYIDNYEYFEKNISEFIEQKIKKSYLDLEYLIENMRQDVYEEHFLLNTNCLPIFTSDAINNFSLQYTLINNSNKEHLYYWRGNKKSLQIESFLDQKAINLLKKNKRPLIAYSFSYKTQEAPFFYSAFEEELNSDGNLDLFINYAVKKDDFAIWQVYLDELFYKDKQDQEPKLSNIILLYKLENSFIKKKHENNIYNAENLDSLNKYLQKTISVNKIKVKPISKTDSNTLYTPYETKVLGVLNNKVFQGVTLGVLAKKLIINIATTLPAKLNDVLYLDLISIQAENEKLRLKDMQFKIVAIDESETIFHLSPIESVINSKAYNFVLKTIQAKSSTDDKKNNFKKPYDIQETLRSKFINSIVSSVFFVHHKNLKYQLDLLVDNKDKSSPTTKFLKSTSYQDLEVNLPSFCSNKIMQNILDTIQKKHIKNYNYLDIMFHFQKELNDNFKLVEAKLIEKKLDNLEATEFIHQTKKNQKFKVFRIFFNHTDDITLDIINNDLISLATTSVSKAKAFEKSFLTISAIGEIINVTSLYISHFFEPV